MYMEMMNIFVLDSPKHTPRGPERINILFCLSGLAGKGIDCRLGRRIFISQYDLMQEADADAAFHAHHHPAQPSLLDSEDACLFCRAAYFRR